MKTNVAQTSIEARHSLTNRGVKGQYDRIVSLLKNLKDGTTRARIAIALGMEKGTVAARVNELVCCGRLIERGDTRVIPQVSNVRSKVVRIA